MQRCRAYFTPINAELERKLFCFTFCVCVFQKQILFFGNTLCLRPGQVFLYVCIYVDVCTYVSNVRDVFIVSMLLDIVTLQPCHSEAHGLPPHRHRQGLHQPGRPECGNKTVNVQDLAAFLLVYKLSDRKK
uniref:Uncharacterized protein n=1 Tax=Pipistrellus kuhlii TaxID=59472 RepID=A0A7J7ZJF3_PIPKU|nr:hypothetical protein mPipKuh1_009626 [Pipistrellus kuhlii]